MNEPKVKAVLDSVYSIAHNTIVANHGQPTEVTEDDYHMALLAIEHAIETLDDDDLGEDQDG